jgi:hypothetical protein
MYMLFISNYMIKNSKNYLIIDILMNLFLYLNLGDRLFFSKKFIL